MSTAASYKKHLPRKNHKERAQPQGRKKWGLLEKHKDYVIRAKDYHKKQDYLRKLKEKAAFRNPDEFYFNMNRSKRKAGSHEMETPSKRYKHSEIMEMQTQDVNYLAVKKQMETKKIEKLQASLHLIQDTDPQKIKKKHTIFVDTEEDVEEFDPEEYFDTPKEFLTRAYNRPTREALKSNHVVSNAEHVSNQDLKKIKKETEKSYVELAARMNREKKIEQELDRAQLKKHLTQGGAVMKKKKDGAQPVYKWRKIRQR